MLNKKSRKKMDTYVFEVELTEEDDGRWSAIVPALRGCGTWGHSRKEALESIREAAQAYIDVLIEDGRPVPLEKKEIKLPIHSPAVAVTV
jgi:predicted RNase H-like HicB family nuclease